ncbi:GNAT family N-acetyltransferase [Litchfieldia alkalitelluris]|uniref:GNAT family N-acetyltransferase n=1 Tax=Litchfieldia alkalitelluris TaxID=304268 RepID=UPI000997986A|nr:GNAT family N-acetyltransferase [Litchfieldia alkalitelluris]
MKTIVITNKNELESAFEIRKKVFVEEQGVPLEDEFDQFDHLEADCKHILVSQENEAVGTGRIRYVDDLGKLERICILLTHRKQGIGNIIIRTLEEIALERGVNKVKLHAQTHAENFYKKLGYETMSDVFIEDGIPHIIMAKKLA